MNYKKEYKKYLTSSILDTANNKIASSSLITAFAVYLGLSDLAIGIYAVLDTITNMLQIFAAPLFSKIGQSKIVVLSNYTIYRLASVGFAFIPFISDNITIRTIFFFIFASIYAVTGEMGYITFVNWRMTLVKKEDRTKFVSSKNMIKNTVVMAFSLFMGVVLDQFKASGYELNGFLTMTHKDILEGAGTISHEKALAKAHEEYDKYMRNHLTQAEKDYLEIMSEDIKKLK